MHQRVSAHTARLMVRALVARTGQPRAQVMHALSLTDSDVNPQDASLTKAAMDALWDQAIRWSGDPGFGLQLSTHLQPGMLGPLEYLVRHEATLGDAYDKVLAFQNLLQQETSRWEQRLRPDGARQYRFALLPPLADARAHIVEFALSSFVAVGRAATATSWVPRSVSFAHERGASPAAYRDRFGVLPGFGADHHQVVLTADTCASPVVHADPQLAHIVQTYVEARAVAHEPGTTSDAVRAALRVLMPRGALSAGDVGRRLGVSERTLRRRLAAEDTSLSALRDEVRFAVARVLLEQQLSAETIAQRLGLADAASFYRAFRRWSGTRLADYRGGDK